MVADHSSAPDGRGTRCTDAANSRWDSERRCLLLGRSPRVELVQPQVGGERSWRSIRQVNRPAATEAARPGVSRDFRVRSMRTIGREGGVGPCLAQSESTTSWTHSFN